MKLSLNLIKRITPPTILAIIQISLSRPVDFPAPTKQKTTPRTAPQKISSAAIVVQPKFLMTKGNWSGYLLGNLGGFLAKPQL